MSEDDVKRLRATLAELQAELKSVDQSDPEMRELLASSLDDIQRALTRPPGAARPQRSVIERLSEAAQHYETSHPTLSGIIGSIIDTASRMGI